MKKHFLLFCAYFTMHLLATAQPQFALAKEGDGIKIYLKDTPNSDIKTFKALASYPFSVDTILACILDLKNSHKWIDGISSGTLLKTVSANEFIFRQVMPLPFPYDNREVVQRVRISTSNDGEVLIAITEANDFSPPLKNHVRMAAAHGYWKLKPTKVGCQIEYVFMADPGENIPNWMINYSLKESPYRTLKQLKEYLQGT